MTMTTPNDRHEFRASLPWIDKITPEALAFRAKYGITKTLGMVTAGAKAFTQLNTTNNVKVKEALKKDTQSAISACNFSASQCVKELKKRGIPFKG